MAIKKFIGTRGVGKTSQLLEYAVDNSIEYVICANPRHMMEKAHSLGFQGLTFISHTSATELEKLFESGEPYVIDEVETFIRLVFNDLQAYTFSIE